MNTLLTAKKVSGYGFLPGRGPHHRNRNKKGGPANPWLWELAGPRRGVRGSEQSTDAEWIGVAWATTPPGETGEGHF